MAKPFHLAWFLQGSSVQAWGEPWTGHIGTTWEQPELFLDMARSLERACFDYILLEDSSYVGESFGGSTEIYLKNAIAVPRQDPSVVAALMSQVTSRIGIVPTFGTYAYHPYLLARLVATLDQVSAGRVGWNAVTGSSDFAAMNVGMDGMPEHDLRYDMADEYMAAVRGLWGSWEPGAIIADRKSGVLIDHTKVHGVNYEGKFFKTRGPLFGEVCVSHDRTAFIDADCVISREAPSIFTEHERGHVWMAPDAPPGDDDCLCRFHDMMVLQAICGPMRPKVKTTSWLDRH